MGDNGNGRCYVIKETGNFYCSIKDCEGIVHILPEGEKKVLRYDEMVVVLLNPGKASETKMEFPFKKNGGPTVGVEIVTSRYPPSVSRRVFPGSKWI